MWPGRARRQAHSDEGIPEVPLRAGCRPHRRDDATLPRGSFSGRGGKALERSATINGSKPAPWTHGGSSRGRSGPRSDPAQALPWRLVHPFGRHRCLTLRTSWRRDMFAGNVVAVKSVAAFSPCGHSMSSQTASAARDQRGRPARAPHVRWRSATTSSPSFLLARSPAESHLARWRRQITDRHGVTDSASSKSRRHTVVVRCKPTA